MKLLYNGFFTIHWLSLCTLTLTATMAIADELKEDSGHHLSKKAIDLSRPDCFPTLENEDKVVMSPIEWDELQMPDLIEVFTASTHTKLGCIGMQWLLSSIKDKEVIQNRQKIIRLLVEDDELFDEMDKLFASIKQGTKLLIDEPADKGRTTFYQGLIDSVTHPLALDTYFWTTFGSTIASTLGPLALKAYTFKRDYDPRLSLLDKSVGKGFINKEDNVSLSDSVLPSDNFTRHAYLMSGGTVAAEVRDKIENEGSFGDRYALKLRYRWTPQDDPEERTKKGLDPYWGGSGKGIDGDSFRWRLLRKAGAFCHVAGFLVVQDLMILSAFLALSDYVVIMHRKITQLQKKFVDIAAVTRALGPLANAIRKIEQRTDCSLEPYAKKMLSTDRWPDMMKKLVEVLSHTAFDRYEQWVYRRGDVKSAEHIFKQTVQDFKPFLQTIAEFEAYLSVAKMVRQARDNKCHYCFVDFVDSDTPYIDVRKAWTPLAKANSPVGNDVKLGVDGVPVRMLITGPNGCGKSTYMKAVGQTIALAQSCGIAPAESAQISIFDGMRLSLHPKEDVLKGISTFMAQKIRIDAVTDYIQQSNSSKKVFVMFDEPFSGTTDVQISQRVYNLGVIAAHYPYAAVCIATHVEKPIHLASNGSFVNCQVGVQEIVPGEFKRTFKIEPGAALWWFNDHARVTRFVDWVGKFKTRAAIAPA